MNARSTVVCSLCTHPRCMHDRVQSCGIALRSPASERPSDLNRYSPDMHAKQTHTQRAASPARLLRDSSTTLQLQRLTSEDGTSEEAEKRAGLSRNHSRRGVRRSAAAPAHCTRPRQIRRQAPCGRYACEAHLVRVRLGLGLGLGLGLAAAEMRVRRT
eukprot:scaffold42406_cov59-Phaeocystis_antarctica.AAC.2